MHALTLLRVSIYVAILGVAACTPSPDAVPTLGRPEVAATTAPSVSAPTASGSKTAKSELVTVATDDSQALNPESLELTPSVAAVPIGTPLEFRALVVFANGSRAVVSEQAVWHISDTSVLAATENVGVYRAQNQGQATVKVEALGLAVSAVITVRDVELTSVKFQPRVIVAGVSQKIYATGIFSDGTTVDLSHAVQWTVGNPAMAGADPDDSNRILGKKFGKTTISTLYDGKSYVSNLEIRIKDVKALAIENTSAFVIKDSTLQFHVVATFFDDSTDDVTDAVTWSVLDTSIATVDATNARGLVRGTGVGTTTLKAAMGDVEDTLQIAVMQADFDWMTIEPANAVLPMGMPKTLTAWGWKGLSKTDISASVVWSVVGDGAAVVTMSNDPASYGEATPHAVGFAVVKIQLGPLSAQTTVQVIEPVIYDLALGAPDGAPYPCGVDVLQLTATALFSDGKTLPFTENVTWSISDATVADISIADGTKGKVTSLKPGTAVVTATYTVPQTNQQLERHLSLDIGPEVYTQLAVTTPTPSVPVGSSIVFVAEKRFSCGDPLLVTNQANWSSSNGALVTITNSGTTRGFATTQGNVTTPETVTATATFGGDTASLTVTVRAKEIISISLSGPTPANVDIGGSVQLAAYGVFSDGGIVDKTNEVAWTSLAPAIITVDDSTAKGRISGVTHGNTKIRAVLTETYGTISAEITYDSVSYCPTSTTVKLVERHCWTLGNTGQSCTDVCGPGKYDSFVDAYFVSQGRNSRCDVLIRALRGVGNAFDEYVAQSGEPGLSCAVYEGAGGTAFGMLFISPAFSATASFPGYRRICSCFH